MHKSTLRRIYAVSFLDCRIACSQTHAFLLHLLFFNLSLTRNRTPLVVSQKNAHSGSPGVANSGARRQHRSRQTSSPRAHPSVTPCGSQTCQCDLGNITDDWVDSSSVESVIYLLFFFSRKPEARILIGILALVIGAPRRASKADARKIKRILIKTDYIRHLKYRL